MPRDRTAYNRSYFPLHYQKNKEKYKAAARAYTERMLTFVRNFKCEKGCMFCGEKEPCCLDLHHIDPDTKEYAIGHMVRNFGKDRLMEEIAKCVVICANCHRKLHAGLLMVRADQGSTQVHTLGGDGAVPSPATN